VKPPGTPPGSLDIARVTKRFGSVAAVDDVTLNVGAGEVVALLGPSGCGKTTTLRVVAGFESADTGSISIDGREVNHLPPYRRNVGVVFQDYALFPHMTVAQNVEYGLRQRGWPASRREMRRDQMLRLVQLDGYEHRKPGALSGGQQQRVALARALAIEPRLLLLDEPLSNLDAQLREALRTELRAILTEVGLTTLVVTHDQSEAMALADRIAVMRNGKIVQIGTPREVYSRPATRFVAEFIGQALWLDGELEGPDETGFVTFRSTSGLGLKVPKPDFMAKRHGVAIRPESWIVSAPPASGSSEISAILNEVSAIAVAHEYLGPQSLLRCRLVEGAQTFSIPHPAGAVLPPIGKPFSVGVKPQDCIVIAVD
jgi:ABC-type Fe3+/spermidine/putrescine transport system ATPase subunit